jgi:hypothetical protein
MSWFPRKRPATAPDVEAAQAALAKSVDDLLGAVQMRHEARHVADRLRAADRRNHFAESVRLKLREHR